MGSRHCIFDVLRYMHRNFGNICFLMSRVKMFDKGIVNCIFASVKYMQIYQGRWSQWAKKVSIVIMCEEQVWIILNLVFHFWWQYLVMLSYACIQRISIWDHWWTSKNRSFKVLLRLAWVCDLQNTLTVFDRLLTKLFPWQKCFFISRMRKCKCFARMAGWLWWVGIRICMTWAKEANRSCSFNPITT